jgi:hypothetical protein
MQIANPTPPSHHFQQFRLSIRLMTADHHLTSLATQFPRIALAIHDFVVATPAESAKSVYVHDNAILVSRNHSLR